MPEAAGVGSDKGFNKTSSDLLNVNDYHTPVKVKNSKTHWLSTAQIMSEMPITTKRIGCETMFKRVQGEGILQERILHWLTQHLLHAHSLAHREVNLFQPLRIIGAYSIVSKDY